MNELEGVEGGGSKMGNSGVITTSAACQGSPDSAVAGDLPECRRPQFEFLGWEDPLEKGKAAHSSILAWRIPWTVQSKGSQGVGHN